MAHPNDVQRLIVHRVVAERHLGPFDFADLDICLRLVDRPASGNEIFFARARAIVSDDSAIPKERLRVPWSRTSRCSVFKQPPEVRTLRSNFEVRPARAQHRILVCCGEQRASPLLGLRVDTTLLTAPQSPLSLQVHSRSSRDGSGVP